MASILLVSSDPAEAEPVRRALAASGHEASVAPGSLYALTLLERRRPDVLVAWPSVGEPTAEELCAILREDPATASLFVVLVRPNGALPPWAPDCPCVAAGAEADLVRDLLEVIGRRGGKAETPHPEGGLAGRLDTIRFVNLVQALAQLRKTGKLRVLFADSESCSYFVEGQLVHATFGSLEGRNAFLESLVEAEAHSSAIFAFDGYDTAKAAAVPRTITVRLESILLEAPFRLGGEGHPDDGEEDTGGPRE